MDNVKISHNTFSTLLSCEEISFAQIKNIEDSNCETAFNIMKYLLSKKIISYKNDGIFSVVTNKTAIYSLKHQHNDWIEEFSEKEIKKAAKELPKNSLEFLKFLKANPGLTMEELNDIVNNGDLDMIDKLLKVRFVVCENDEYYCTITKQAWKSLGHYLGVNIPQSWNLEMEELESLTNPDDINGLEEMSELDKLLGEMDDELEELDKEFENEIDEFEEIQKYYDECIAAERIKAHAEIDSDSYDEILDDDDERIEIYIYDLNNAIMPITIYLQNTPYEIMVDAVERYNIKAVENFFVDTNQTKLIMFKRDKDLFEHTLSTFALMTPNGNVHLDFFKPIIEQANVEINALLKAKCELKFNCRIVMSSVLN